MEAKKNKKQKLGLFKILIFSLIPLVLLLFIGEIAARIRLYRKNKDIFYLIGPFFEKKQVFEKAEKQTLKEQVNYELRIDNFYGRGGQSWYFKLKPGSYPSLPRYQYGNFTVNSLGFRGKEFKPFDKNGKIRIFCIGESSTLGLESPDDQTWPARLEYYLQQKIKDKFEVINSGFASYYSFNYSNLIREELVNYKPDYFIIYAGINDLNRSNEWKKVSDTIYKAHMFLYYRSMLYTLLAEKISVMFQNNPTPMFIFDVKAVDNYVNNLNKIIEICKDNNIKLILVRQVLNAHKDIFKRDNLPLEEIKKIQSKSLYDSNGKYWSGYLTFYRYNELMQSLAKLCTKYNIKLLDFREAFYNAIMKNDIIFNDDVHLTPQGNDLLAKLISQRLLAAYEDKNKINDSR